MRRQLRFISERWCAAARAVLPKGEVRRKIQWASILILVAAWIGFVLAPSGVLSAYSASFAAQNAARKPSQPASRYHADQRSSDPRAPLGMETTNLVSTTLTLKLTPTVPNAGEISVKQLRLAVISW